MRNFVPILVIIVACLSSSADTNQVARVLPGGWKSVELGGQDMGNHIKSMRYRFATNSTFTVFAKLEKDGAVQYSGTYLVVSNGLSLTIPEKGTEVLPYSYTNGVLEIRDRTLDSWIRFRKESRTKQSTRTKK